MAHIAITQKKTGVDGWPPGVRYFIYDSGLSCDEGKALFLTYTTVAQKLANTQLSEPPVPQGKQKQLRNCQATTVDDGYFEVDSKYFEDAPGGGGGGGTTQPSDPGAESNVVNYTSASGDDGGVK